MTLVTLETTPAEAVDDPTEGRRLFALAVSIAAFSTACCAIATVLAARTADVGILDGIVAGDTVLGSVWPIVGALIVRARPRNPVGWLMLVPALIGPYQVAGFYAASSNGEGPLGVLAAWFAVWGFAPYFFTLPVLPHVFPDGRPLSPRWGKVVAVTLGVAVVTTLARMFSPVPADLAPDVLNPLGVEGAIWLRYITMAGAASLFVVGVPLAVLSLLLRMRRAREPERTQLYWLVLGGIVLVCGAVIPFGGSLAQAWGLTVGLVGFPLGIGIGMLRHRLFDVELTLNRTLVLGAITGAVVAVYVVVVYVADAVAPGSRWGVLLVAVAAIAAASARDRVQDVVDRWLFGHRHNAYAVVSRVGRGVAAASRPVDALQLLVEGLREALRMPYAAFTSTDGAVSVASGEPTHGARVVTVTALGQPLGELHVGLRSRAEKWTADQESAVQEVADRAGTLAYAASLVTDIARSRGRIVVAREEERRRLRADLHDGVAPALAGTALQLESLARRLDKEGQAELAERALGLRDGLRDSVGELRALVHGLRPPVLDQRGLAGALRNLAAGHDQPEVDVRIDDLGEPHAAIEVAAYAIAAEAFGNALRHGSASRVVLAARRVDGEIVVSVSDNGVGMPPRPRAGVGLVSMRERASEVGGRFEVAPSPGGGTTVVATLPLEIA